MLLLLLHTLVNPESRAHGHLAAHWDYRWYALLDTLDMNKQTQTHDEVIDICNGWPFLMFEFFFSLHVSFNDRIECIYNIDLPTTHLRHHRDLFVSLNVLNHFNLVCCIISFLLACFLLLLFLSQIVTLMRVRGVSGNANCAWQHHRLENVLKRETRTCKLLCAHIHICVCVQHIKR